MKLSNRLMTCAAFVKKGSSVADVGTDHGYLGIYLVENHIAEHVYATDLREAPIQNAIRNANKHSVFDKMSFQRADGLNGIKAGTVDTVICAGMGADCIIKILDAAPWLKELRTDLILQPQSSQNDLRMWLYENGYKINKENLAQDGNFLYNIMECSYSGICKKLTPRECYVSDALLNSNDELLNKYIDKIRNNLLITVKRMTESETAYSSRIDYYKEVLGEINKLKEEIENGNCC